MPASCRKQKWRQTIYHVQRPAEKQPFSSRYTCWYLLLAERNAPKPSRNSTKQQFRIAGGKGKSSIRFASYFIYLLSCIHYLTKAACTINIYIYIYIYDQHEHTFSNYVRIQDVVLKTCLGRWTIGRSGERGSGISVLPARHDDDIYIYIYI